MRTTFTLVRNALRFTPRIKMNALLELPAFNDMTLPNRRRTVFKWIQSDLLTRDGDEIALGPKADAERRKLCERSRESDCDEPTEDPSNDTWVIWTQAGMVETFGTSDVMEWLDLDSKPEAWEVVRANVKGRWLLIVQSGRDARYARWDRGGTST